MPGDYDYKAILATGFLIFAALAGLALVLLACAQF